MLGGIAAYKPLDLAIQREQLGGLSEGGALFRRNAVP
jgi:hypothetical protein